ncbi:MAG: DUF2203 domain-containing protein [Actinobacteria bacterium]|nr:DUF2203 domain-containing protein [Actinomycetota bacterium]
MEQNRYFTQEEANALLSAVRPLAERMVAHRAALDRAQGRLGEFLEHISGNGGGLQPAELAEAHAAVEQEAGGIARCVDGIQELGGMVKDVGEGLVDFLAKREHEDVLLCWKLGEDEIAHWHGLEEGFAGRKPV